MYAKASDGTEIHYKIKKRGEKTILILSQIGLNMTSLEPFTDSFSEDNISIILIELRNHGKSGSGKVSMDSFIKDINAVVEKEKIKRLSILGACFNNPIAVEFAHRFPNKVKGVILCNLTVKEFSNLKIRVCFSIIKPIEKILQLLDFSHSNKKKYIDMRDIKLRGIIHSIYQIHKMMSIKTLLIILDRLQKYALIKRINSLSIPTLIYQEIKNEFGRVKILKHINNKKVTKMTGNTHIPNDQILKEFRSFVIKDTVLQND